MEHIAVAVVALVWVFVVTPSWGGFHDQRTAVGLVALMPALVATRPWWHVGLLPVVLVGATAGGALVVLGVSPTGWSQADSVATQLAGLLALVVTASYARSSHRREAVLLVLLLALLVQFRAAWLPWFGSGDPNHVMVGTFYWHNQLGAYMAALGVLATVLAIAGAGPLRLTGLLTAPFAYAAVVLSTSRASLALLIVGWLTCAAFLWKCQRRRLAAARWVAVPATASLLLFALTSPVFFPDGRWSGPSALQRNASASSFAGERGFASISGASGVRMLWTRTALRSWADSPLLGHGFGSFTATEDERLPPGAPRSRYVHNAYAEALTSGGLIFGGPLLVGVALLVLLALRAFARSTQCAPDRAMLGGAAVATLIWLAHSAVDFDWHYSSLTVACGVTAGVVYAAMRPAALPQNRPAQDGRRTTGAAVAVAASLIAVASIGVTASLV